jgi:homoserine O-acetyltransferase/O-succinyltransferase
MILPLLLLSALQVSAPTASAGAPVAAAAKTWPAKDGEVTLKNFRFGTGETLPELKLHYLTLGKPHRNLAGVIDNAVMVLHGTGGSGAQFLRPQFADELYGPGQPLDINKYWIILPDNIGHGGSSKPSDGLRMKFPKYTYDDMVEAQRAMLGKLGVTQLRLIMGTSMGCMHIFIWGEKYPSFAKALMPLACQPIEIAGLNRMWRQLLIDGIKNDIAWGEGKSEGEYDQEPVDGLRTAESILLIVGGAPLYLQKEYPTRESATAYVQQAVEKGIAGLDANDMIYQFDSSRNYNPWPGLEKITAPMMWVNSADDFINPRNLDVPQRAVKRMKNARFRLIPESDDTHGHGTHTWAKFWKADLIELLERSE